MSSCLGLHVSFVGGGGWGEVGSMDWSVDERKGFLIGLVVKVSALRAVDVGSIPAFAVDIFAGRLVPVTRKLVVKWLPY